MVPIKDTEGEPELYIIKKIFVGILQFIIGKQEKRARALLCLNNTFFFNLLVSERARHSLSVLNANWRYQRVR